MSEVAPDAETLRRVDVDERFLRWIIPRLAGDRDQKETTLTMLYAYLEARYDDGVHDAAWVAQQLAGKKPASHDLAAVAKALNELEQRNRSEPVTSF